MSSVQHTSGPVRALAQGQLAFGLIALNCYVLGDERRVLSQRAIVRAITADQKNIEKAAGPKGTEKPAEPGRKDPTNIAELAGPKVRMAGDLSRDVFRLPDRFCTHLAEDPIAIILPGGGRCLARSAPFYTNLHQFLQDPVREVLADGLRFVEMIIDQVGSVDEFWRRCEAHFLKKPLQLSLVVGGGKSKLSAHRAVGPA